MPWDVSRFPPSMQHLGAPAREKAIEIANALLAEGMDEGRAIRIAIAKAKAWAAPRGGAQSGGVIEQPGPAPETPPAPARGHWEHFDHGADIGVRGYGATKAAAFEQAALALTAVVTDPALVAARETVPIACKADDDELLLVAWLNAVVTEMGVRRMLFALFHVEIRGANLSGRAVGERVNVQRHRPGVEVKGATCTSLRVGRMADGTWLAQTVVDV